jgi:spore cortex biosynthesis protein YabQ
MWEINNYFQWLSFGRAILLGAFLCLIYDIIRLLRYFTDKKTNTFLGDVLFFIISSVFTFSLLLSNTNGQLRLYIFVGIVIGFALFRLLISNLLFCIFKPIKKILIKIRSVYIKFIGKIQNISFSKIIKQPFEKIKVFLYKKIKIS